MKKYGNDFKKGKKGYEYTGDWYRSSLGNQALQQRGLILLAQFIGAAALFAAGLCLNNAGSRAFFVLIPYMCAVFPIAYGCMGAFSLYSFCKKMAANNTKRTDGGKNASEVIVPKEHEKDMLRSEYEQSIVRSARSAWVLIIFSALALVSDIVLLAKGKGLLMGQEVLFAAITIFILLIGAALTRQTAKIKASFTKNH